MSRTKAEQRQSVPVRCSKLLAISTTFYCVYATICYVVAVFNRIALMRADRRISRRELAEAVGVNPQTIGYLERGDYKPSLELAMHIAAYFGVPVEMIFSFTPFEPVAQTLMRGHEPS